MSIKTFLIALAFIGVPACLYAQDRHTFQANLLTVEDGLANLLTTAIFKSNDGFVWVGTSYGLNRYDGTWFRLYTKENNNLAGNFNIRQISEAPNKKLLLFYKLSSTVKANLYQDVDAVDVFDLKTERAIPFETYFAGKAPFKVSELVLPNVLDPEKRSWFATSSGDVFLYDGNFKRICHLDAPAQFISVENSGRICIGQEYQIVSFDQNGNLLQSYASTQRIRGVFSDGTHGTWFCTEDNGVFHFWNLSPKGTVTPFLLRQKGALVTVPSSSSLFVHRDQKGYWFTDIRGQLNVFSPAGEWLFNFNTLLDKQPNLQFVQGIEDSHSMWFSTPGGVLHVSVKDQLFKLVQRREDGLSDCRGITEDTEGNIYFLNKQLYKWNKHTQNCSKITNTVLSHVLIHLDSLILAGSYSENVLGVDINLKTKQEWKYPTLEQGFFQALSWAKTKEPGKILIGQNQGLAYINVKSKKIIPFEQYNEFTLLRNSEVFSIHENHSGYWLATNNGMFLLSAQAGVVRHFDVASGDLPFNVIRHIYEDRDGVFWLATKGGGIIRWEPSLDVKNHSKFRQFTASDGLSNNYTYAVHEDRYGKLWVPSDKGLMCIDKNNFEVRTFLTEDGLPHNEFNQGAHYQAKDGALYFGGLGGLIEVNPQTVADNGINTTPLQFTGYYLLQADDDHISDKTRQLQDTNLITIRSGDKFFEVHFNLMDFDASSRHQYAYMIEGFQDNWNITKDNYIRITNLPYGEYNLKIKGQHWRDGWSNQVLSLKIRVLPPFYMRWWFIAAMILLVILAIVAYVKWKTAKLHRDRAWLESEVQSRTRFIQESNDIIKAQAEALQEADKVKSRFLANITHELRTPLTLIITPLEQMKREPIPLVLHKRLNGMLNNSYQLLDLINQMLDLSKLEAGNMKKELNRGDIIEYTGMLTDRFLPLTEKKNLRIGFVANLTSWHTYFDQDKWNKIIYNLLSNAVKFTPENGAVQVCIGRRISDGVEYIYLAVKDTGIGVPPETLPHLFNRFYQADDTSTRNYGGMGIGLALVHELVDLLEGNIWVTSTVGKGTSFEVMLPVMIPASETIPFAPSSMDQLHFPGFNTFTPEVEAPVRGTKHSDKLELLIIEDHDEMRKYISSCFDKSRYNITEARLGLEGLEIAHEIIPDVIISDVMMPQMDGFAVTKAIRSHFSTSHIPVVLLTAKTSLESRLDGLKYGADAYLTKPFSPQELVLRIEQLIESRRALQLRFRNLDEMVHAEEPEREDAFILELKAYIRGHLNEDDLNGDLIGRKFGLSRVHLYRKLKAITGMSISELVKMVRLEQAYELVAEGKLNISEIAYQTGFSSHSFFTRAFKQSFGKSPSEVYGTRKPISGKAHLVKV